MKNNRLYFSNRENISRFMNGWDIVLLIIFASILFFLGLAGQQMATPYALGDPIVLSLDPIYLPGYALRTVFRMFIALFFSVLFTFMIGTWAAKNKRIEMLVIPAIDILQSVPVLSFLAMTITGFIHLFPGSLLGPECASIFVIFTAQVWNIIFSFYQSLKTVPHDLIEASRMLQLSAWQRFWKVEVPCTMSGLLWNLMMSMSASWFFVVLSEAIVVAHQDIHLPGLGSYIALAIESKNLQALGYAIMTMVLVIFSYDQLLFRPLLAWSEKFRLDEVHAEMMYQSWMIDVIRKSPLMQKIYEQFGWFKDQFMNIRWPFQDKVEEPLSEEVAETCVFKTWLWYGLLCGMLLCSGYFLYDYIFKTLAFQEIWRVMLLGAMTSLRVIVLIVLSSIFWIPIGVFLGRQPFLTQKAQAVIQFLAAFPANLFYPLCVIAIVRYHLNVEIWVTPLMILGTQWYILFNVIAGASRIPRDLCLAADNFGVKGWQWWRRLALPAIFPYYITGAISAAGGAWNASIVSEWVSWGDTTLQATGLGEYIHASTLAGHFEQLALGTVMMCVDVLLFNQLVWRPLYRLAQARFSDAYS